jgi:formylglycine-generating enzyme required for sulfatase activity
VSWYEAAAFCISDGGFLPSEVEGDYAAAAGSEQRAYAWGATAPGPNASLAVYGCYYNGTGTCSGLESLPRARS